MRAITLALLISCTPAQRTTALALSSTALIAADWRQTQDITAACQEINPVIGQCGEITPPNLYFPFVIIAHLAIGLAMREHWRTVWFAGIAGAEASTLWSNTQRK